MATNIPTNGGTSGGGGVAGVSSVNTRTGDVTLGKADVALSNVDNTADIDKPVSTATQTALDGKVEKVVSTDNALVRFDGTGGSVQDSGAFIDDAGRLSVSHPVALTTIASTGAILVVNSDDTNNNYGLISFADNTAHTSPNAKIGVQYTDRTLHYGDLVLGTRGAAGLTEKVRIKADGHALFGRTYSAGERIGIGGGTATIASVTSAIGIYNDIVVSSAQTGSYTANVTYLGTQAQPFNLANLIHYRAGQGGIGAGSSVTNQYAYYADAALIGATNNYGFFSAIPSGTGRWNFYANGTAPNYFGGNVTMNAEASVATGLTLGTNCDVYQDTSGTYGWRDNIVHFEVRGSGAADPSWGALWGGLEGYLFSATTLQRVFCNFHIDHDIARGTVLFPHIHWTPTTTATGVVRWGIFSAAQAA
jgi:hypothetical protein